MTFYDFLENLRRAGVIIEPEGSESGHEDRGENKPLGVKNVSPPKNIDSGNTWIFCAVLYILIVLGAIRVTKVKGGFPILTFLSSLFFLPCFVIVPLSIFNLLWYTSPQRECPERAVLAFCRALASMAGRTYFLRP